MRNIDIVIPTYKNPYWISRCLISIQRERFQEIGTIFIVDNGGDFDHTPYFDLPIKVLRPGRNIGWTKALNHSMGHVTSDYVMFLNDDTEFEAGRASLADLLSHFDDEKVGAVGPATGVAAGLQGTSGPDIETVKLLIGFCLVMPSQLFRDIGMMDEQFRMGGDDLDISIRLIDKGYKLILDRRVFVHHNAFKTGNRVYGGPQVKGGWNSRESATHIHQVLAQKHGIDKLRDTVTVPANRF